MALRKPPSAGSIFCECELTQDDLKEDELTRLRAAASEAEALRAESNRRLEDLESIEQKCMMLRSTVAAQAQQLEAAYGMLDSFLKNSREVSEGDCIYCNCELGGGNDDDCYYDCPMNEVRAWLAANAPAPEVDDITQRMVDAELKLEPWATAPDAAEVTK